jgi:hypothetical protein
MMNTHSLASQNSELERSCFVVESQYYSLELLDVIALL